jgi:hypothetical protein
MAHPHQEHRAHKVEQRRIAHITKGYAGGGSVHSDAPADKKLVRGMVKPAALKMHGGKTKHRADKPHRASGGRVKHGKKHGTNVNVIVAPQGGHAGLGGAPMAAAPPAPPQGAPAPMPRPMMPPPGGASPPGAAPMPSPGMMGPRARGGRAYAAGGRVKSGPAWEEGKRNGTQVQHNESGKTANQKDQPSQLNRGKVVTFMTGGAVEHPKKGGMAPKLAGGAGGGEARLQKPGKIIIKSGKK